MTEAEVYEFTSGMFMAVLIASTPVLIIALVTGLVIAFVQALTQIQEMTLTFVPKILVIFVALLATTPFIYATLERLSTRGFDAIASGGL
ncbi:MULTISPECIES: flagellar biosynthetic protein FliQ [unclassified Roseivivax]|uniref:flagellar biosynthetic protein FliQ n=1 Tax=Roseivivax sp. GX 12232 TaxID=2900547 RepID=UPI001E648D31|nr:flagellar biosynthetic protein FliQ [Roseivivax sp. GX 12232]MCE0503866.1 flagellar biosynthetic protein FliQ [Roseivivax sp. GX 12232]